MLPVITERSERRSYGWYGLTAVGFLFGIGTVYDYYFPSKDKAQEQQHFPYRATIGATLSLTCLGLFILADNKRFKALEDKVEED